MNRMVMLAIVVSAPLALAFAAFLVVLIRNLVILIDKKIGLTQTLCYLLIAYVCLRILDL